MKVLDPGHAYQLQYLDGPQDKGWDTLVFVKREGENYPGNVGHHAGTTMQEVLRALIDRVQYVNGQVPDPTNEQVLQHLRSAIWYLELRAARRHGRQFRAPERFIETSPTCPKCLHIGCEGACHP